MIPFYDPLRTYEDNYAHGPFGVFREPSPYFWAGSPRGSFLGHPVNRPFGIPAGPLLNAAFCAAAFRHGYDVNVYKTVRTRSRQAHPFPNTLAVHLDGQLTVARAGLPVVADDDFRHVTSITNSFGVPSRDPDEWQPDMARAVTAAGPGQLLVGSFQGTRDDGNAGDRESAFIAGHVRAATRDIVQGYAAVNTMSASLVGPDGRQALPGEGRDVGGVCGAAISWAGLEMVGRLATLRDRGRNDLSIIGVGGVRTQEDYSAMRHAGAAVVMSATGAMFDPLLGVRIQGAAEGARSH